MDFIDTGNIITNIVYNIAGSDYKDLVTIAFGWKSVVGEIIAERARIYKIENNILFVAVTNNVWMQELILRKYQIIDDLKKKLFVNINDIIFFISN